MIKLNLSARITSIRMFSCAVEIEYHGQGKIKSKQCWDIKISQRGCEMRGISCRGSFSYHREGQPGSEEESIEGKLFSKQATLQVPSGCLIRQMLCVRRPSFIIGPTLFSCGLCGPCPASAQQFGNASIPNIPGKMESGNNLEYSLQCVMLMNIFPHGLLFPYV